MASRHPFRCLQALRPLRPLRPRNNLLPVGRASYHASPVLRSADTPAAPAFLSTIKQDLKTAMRQKDAARLAVLRAVITATNNAAKTSSPIATDVQLVALLRKNLRASQDAAAEAAAVGRPDLADKEHAQAAVLEEYIASSGVATVTEAQVVELINKALADVRAAGVESKAVMGRTMQAVAEGLKGRDIGVSMGDVKNLVKDIVSKA